MTQFPKIPGYEIKKHLGGGGMADVFMAVPEHKNKLVAIKIMNRLSFDPQHVRRFMKEAQTISDLKHPNIVPILEVGKTDSSHFIVMEFYPESLGDRIKKRGQIPPAEALAIVSQLATTLYYIHGKGYVHRDIKPFNIMFRTDGLPVILDFGIARALVTTTRLTVTGLALGTPRYMSPEQIQTQKLDGRSDIYSLGVVLYEMLTGKPPYKGSNQVAVTIKHIMEGVPQLPPDLQDFQPLVERMMAKDRAGRPGTEEEWLSLVRPLLKPFTLPKVQAVAIPAKKAGERDKTKASSRSGKLTAIVRRAGPRPKKNKRGIRRFWIHLLLILALTLFIVFNLELIAHWGRSLLAAIGSLFNSLLEKIFG